MLFDLSTLGFKVDLTELVFEIVGLLKLALFIAKISVLIVM